MADRRTAHHKRFAIAIGTELKSYHFHSTRYRQGIFYETNRGLKFTVSRTTENDKNVPKVEYMYSYPHLRTLISEFRLIVFLFNGCLAKNQPESVLKLFSKLFQ